MTAFPARVVAALVALSASGAGATPASPAHASADERRAADSTSAAVPVEGGRLTARAEIGFDSFEERYSIVDQDTVDSVSEWRARLRLGWARGTLLRNHFLVAGRILAGEGNYETAARLRVTRQLGSDLRSRLSFEGDVTSRGFDDNSSFQFPNDFLRYYIHSYVQIGTGDVLSFRLSDRYERLDYERRNEFDYDYGRNTVSIGGEYEWDLTSSLTGALRYTTMSVPDSSEIEYDSYAPYLEFRSAPGLRRQIYAHGTAERRRYTSAQASRSSFWALLANLSTEWSLAEEVTIGFDDDFEYYTYDENSDAYFDYVENRAILVVSYYPSYDLKLGVGGAFGSLAAAQSLGDEYYELGAVVRVEFNRGAELWLSLQYEPGRRVYPTFDPNVLLDLESVFSDYNYHRVSLFGSWRMWNGLGLNVFLDYQPEDHEREGDDATATLFSASVSYVM